MLHARQVLDERLEVGAHGLVGNLVVQLGLPDLLAPLPQPLAQLLLDARRRPHEPGQAAVAR